MYAQLAIQSSPVDETIVSAPGYNVGQNENMKLKHTRNCGDMKTQNRNIPIITQHKNGSAEPIGRDLPSGATEVVINLAPFEFGIVSGVMKANGCDTVGEAVELILTDSGICEALLNNGMEIAGLDVA